MTARTETRLPVGERADGSLLTLPVIRWQGEAGARPVYRRHHPRRRDHRPGQPVARRRVARAERAHGERDRRAVQNPEGFNYDVRGIPAPRTTSTAPYPGDENGDTHERITAAITKLAVRGRRRDRRAHRRALHSLPAARPGQDQGLARAPRSSRARPASRSSASSRATATTRPGLAASLPPVVLAAGQAVIHVRARGPRQRGMGTAEAGAIALRNVIRHLGIVNDEHEAVHGVVVKTTDGHRRRAVFAERGGIVEFTVRPGDDVTRGKRIGRIRDVWGRVVEEVLAPADGFVIGLSATGATWTGGYLAEIAARA
jgi:predicted deacylase